jgi:hypothetical protein
MADASMTSTNTRRLVRIVIAGRKAKVPESVIRERLADIGVSAKDIPNVIDAIEKGFKHGTVSVVTGGLSSTDIPSGQNPFFDAAFRMGRSAMRWSTPVLVLVRVVLPIVIVAGIVGVIAYAIAK